jgi:hypothetical protein
MSSTDATTKKQKKKGKKPNENKTFVDSPSSSKAVHG